jgi:hypothetical protein
MRMSIALLTMTALALTACSRGGTANNMSAGNASAGNTTAPAANSATPAAGNDSAEAAESGGGGTVDVAFLTGRWGLGGDCSQTMEFRADGTASPPEGSTYTVSGNVVTVTDPGRPPDPRTVTRTSDDSMTVSGNGSTMTLTRCE